MNDIVFRHRRHGDPQKMIRRLISNKVNFFVRTGSDCTEIQVDDTLFTYISTNNFPKNKLFLFQMVKRDVVKWLGDRTYIDMPPRYESSSYNFDYDDTYGNVGGTDLNHAYWRIALLKGLISQKTYDKGLTGDCKALRLATLSILGREKKFVEYKEGEIIDEHITQPENILLKQIFEYIRLTCFNMMHELAFKLGNDFDCWKTDCIYYRDTPENRALVHEFFDKRNFTYKQLDYFEDEQLEDLQKKS